MEENQALAPKGGGDDCDKSKAEPPPKSAGGGDGGGVVYKYKRGAWSKEEDEKLRKAVEEHGDHNWITIERSSGLARPAKNCRLRWTNYLRPNLKKCPFTPEEEAKILLLHSKYGNSWSRIASKLPGRSDNEIKNFWHKRAKKCLPIYPTRKQEDQQSIQNGPNTNSDNNFTEQKNAIDEFWPKEHQTPTNYPQFTLPSSSINSEFQSPSFSVPNTAFFQPDSLGSPQASISTLQPQFLPSPRSLPCYQQSPTNHFSQTIPSPHTPTSQLNQNLLLSPQQVTRSCPSTPNSAPQIQAPSPQQGNGFTTDRKPPILLPPLGRFKRSREMSQMSLSGSGSGSSVENASVLLNSESSLQKQCSSAIESPRTPLKLNLSPGMHELYSVHNTPDSSSVFQLKSPTPPLSPPNLHLSSLSSPHSKPSYGSLDLSPVHQSSFSFDHDIPMDSSFTFKAEPLPVQYYQPTTAGVSSSLDEVETDRNLEILDALREAQAKVRFLKKKLRETELITKKENPGKESFVVGIPESTGLIGNGLRTKSFEDSLKVNAPRKNSRTKDVIKIISRNKDEVSGKISKTGVLLVKSPITAKVRRKPQKVENSESGNHTQDESTDTEEQTRDENSGAKSLMVDNLQGEEHSMGERNSMKGKNTLTNQKQMQSVDLYDHVNSQNITSAPSFLDSWAGIQFPLKVPTGKSLNECSSLEGLQSERSSYVQDSFLIGDLLGKTSGIEGQLAADEQEPLIDAFDPIFNQSIANTLEKYGDGGGQLSYLQPDEGGYFVNSIGQGSSDGMERRFTKEQTFMELNQLPTTNRLDSNYMASKQIRGYGHMGGKQYSHEISGDENLAEISNLCESSLSLNQYPTDNLLDSGYQVTSLMFKECPEGNSLQTSRELKTECGLSRAWKQQPSWEQNMDGSSIENIWPERTMASQEQRQLNKFGSVVDPSAMAHLIGSSNWNSESSSGSTGKVPGPGHEHDLINTMPEELSSLLEFFATSIQTPEWYYSGNAIPNTEASDEFNMDVNLHMSTTSPPVTFADFI